MDKLRDFRNVLFKQSQRIGIGHHHAGDFRSLHLDDGFQVFHVDSSVGETLHFQHFQPAYGGHAGFPGTADLDWLPDTVLRYFDLAAAQAT